MLPDQNTSPVGELVKGFTRFLESGEDADLKIECKERTWTVHALILRAQSTFFDAACKGGFKESQSRIIKLQDELPDMVDRMISYLYKLNYFDSQVASPRQADTPSISPLDTHVKMYAMGDKFGIVGLKRLAMEKFEVGFDSLVDANLDLFLRVIPQIFSSTPDTDDGLRGLAVLLPLTRYGCYKRLAGLPDFRSVILKTPGFALGLIVETAQRVGGGKCLHCKKHVYAIATSMHCSSCHCSSALQ